MKKLMATVLLALMAAGVCSAQWYVGGAISYGTKHTTTGNDVRTSEFSFTPRVGYVFNDRMLAGLQVAYANSCEKTTISDVIDLTSETTLNMGGIAPYFRYNVATAGRFTFGLEATLSVGLGVAPVVSFGLTEHWWAEAYMQLFALNYTGVKDADGTVRSSTFNFGFDADNIFSFSALHFGVVYRF